MSARPAERRWITAPEVRLEVTMERHEFELAAREFVRACNRLPDLRALIERDPSPDNLRAALQATIDVLLRDSDMQDMQLGDVEERLRRLERQSGIP